MGFYKRILKIPWTERVSDKKVLKKISPERTDSQNLEKTSKIPSTRNEEVRLGNPNPHRTY